MHALSSYAHPFPDHKNASLTMGRTVNQAVKQDTSAIHEYAVAIKMNTEDILARVNSIRRDGHANRHKGVEDWIEDMAVLSSYAETTYQGTIIDPADMADMAGISESLPRPSEDSVLSPSPRGPSPDHFRHTVAARPREADPTGSLPQHAARMMLGEISASSSPSGSTIAPSGVSADNLDSSTLTSTLTRNFEDMDRTGNDMSNRLTLFGWRQQPPFQKPTLGQGSEDVSPDETGGSLLFRTALKCFQSSSEALVPGRQPPEAHHHCEISLFEWLPALEASAMANAPSFVYFTVTLSPNVSDTPLSPGSILFSIPQHGSYKGQPEAGDEEVILTFFDAKSLQEFRGHLMGSSPRLNETRQEFALAGYNALEYGGLGTPARIPRPIDKLLTTTHTWPKVSLFEPFTLGPPHRLIVESQDGRTLINNRIGPHYHKFIRLGSVKADDCLLVINQSLKSASRSNFLLLNGSPESAKPASINVNELQGIHPEQQAYCEYRFQNLGSLYRFQQAMTGYAVLFDGWPNGAMFGRHRDFTILTVPGYVSWGHSAKKPRLQILKDTGNGAIRLAIFCPPRRRHPESSQASFLLRREKHFIHYSARYTVSIKDDSGTLPLDTIDAWKGVSPNEANFLDLSVGGGETGQSNEVLIEFKEEAGKQMRPPCKYFCCTPASIWR